MSWDDVGNAIQQAVARAANLTDDKVIWKDQDYSAPGTDYATVRLGGPLPRGIDYIQTYVDETRPLGQEVELRATGRREVPLEIEFFTGQAVSGKSTSALQRAASFCLALTLPTVRGILAAQDVVPFDPGAPQWIPDVPSTKFRGRAVVTVRCRMPAPTASEYTGFIERVSGTVNATGPTGEVLSRAFDTNDAG